MFYSWDLHNLIGSLKHLVKLSHMLFLKSDVGFLVFNWHIKNVEMLKFLISFRVLCLAKNFGILHESAAILSTMIQ